MTASRLGQRTPSAPAGSPERPPDRRLPPVLWACLAATVVPVPVVARSGVELAPVDLVIPVLLLYGVKRGRHFSGAVRRRAAVALLLAWLAVLWAFAAALTASAGLSPNSPGLLRQLGSLAFTFRPLLLLLAGVLLIRRGYLPRQLLNPLGLVAALVSTAAASGLVMAGEEHLRYGAVAYGGGVRTGQYLGGTLLGLPLYGQFGVNSLATTYAVYGIVCAAALLAATRRVGSRAGASRRGLVLHGVLALGVMSSVFLVTTSGSRQALILVALGLGTPLCAWLLTAVLAMDRRGAAGLLTVVLVVVSLYSAYRLAGMGAGRLDTLASGRVTNLSAVLEQVRASPFLGSGFMGVEERTAAGLSSLNAHNLFVNLAFKVGVPGALLYVGALLAFVLPAMARLVRGTWRSWAGVVEFACVVMIFLIGSLSNSLDVATATGPLLLLLGAVSVTADSGSGSDHPVSPGSKS